MKLLRILICVAFAGLIFFYSTISHAATFIHFSSEPGDYIGQGIEQTLTTDDGVFTASRSDNVVTVSFDGSTWWNLRFAAPEGQQLQPGPYEEATRYPFQSPTEPGLDVSGDGRGCNELTGRFDVLEAVYTVSGEIERFAADFEQHCEGDEAALFGSVRYNATVGFPPKVSITANGSRTPIIINAGETVEIKISMEAGDKEGVMAERWFGVLGQNGNSWYRGNKWSSSAAPLKWNTKPFSTFEKVIQRRFSSPGVYLFMFAADEQIDGKLNTQYIDHVVITVTRP